MTYFNLKHSQICRSEQTWSDYVLTTKPKSIKTKLCTVKYQKILIVYARNMAPK